MLFLLSIFGIKNQLEKLFFKKISNGFCGSQLLKLDIQRTTFHALLIASENKKSDSLLVLSAKIISNAITQTQDSFKLSSKGT